MAKKPLLVLVDGSSYLYRAFHALPPLTNSKGQPTGAIYGVVNMMRKLLADYPYDYVAVVFDAKGKTFRDDMYEEYKSNRAAMPDDLSTQIPYIHEILAAMGLPILMVEGVEADDVIGTLVTEAVHNKWQVIVSTGDKDMSQLVTDDVHLINTMTNVLLDPAGVEAKFGLPAKRMIDYFSLVGDSVDNIPGVPGVGPKTALKWLLEYGSLDKLISNADKITGKVGERLRDNLEKLPLWRDLVTIKKDVALDIEPDQLIRKPDDTEQLTQLFADLEFKTWLRMLTEKASSLPANNSNANYQIIKTQAQAQDLLTKCEQAPILTFNLYTEEPEHALTPCLGMSIALGKGVAFYLPSKWLKIFKAILENPKKLKLTHNIKLATTILANCEITLQGQTYDTLLEAYLLHTTSIKHDLVNLAEKFLNFNKMQWVDIVGKGQKQIQVSDIPAEQMCQYAGQTSDITYQLHAHFWPDIASNDIFKSIFNRVDIPLAVVLSHMEFYGVLIDSKLLKKQSHELAERIEVLEQEIYKKAKCEFNIASPKQLQEVLYDKLNLPILQKTATGQPSTAEEVLQELSHTYPLPKFILEYRSLTKLKSTYTDSLPLQVNAETGRIHTSYNQAGTSTGRLSSSDPNLQNIPIRNSEGRRIRQAFIAPKNHVILSSDYSQIELRLMADLSHDPRLVAAFKNNQDIHRATAAEVLGITPEEVDSEQRRQAKVINFGIIYGMSAFGLAKELEVPREAAQDYINLYFARYPEVKKYMEKTREFAHQHGYVQTLLGRRLYIPDINSKHIPRQKAAERAAINGPLQGSAADIIKLAMIKIDQFLKSEKLQTKMILQVHDELVFEVPQDELALMTKTVRELMITATPDLKVPLEVDISHGPNWDEAH